MVMKDKRFTRHSRRGLLPLLRWFLLLGSLVTASISKDASYMTYRNAGQGFCNSRVQGTARVVSKTICAMSCTQTICNCEQFKCPNEACIYKSQLCDGLDDCGDGSDEENCSAPCPPPWVSIGPECFRIHCDIAPWQTGRDICNGEGGDLAQPNDLASLRIYLVENAISSYYWIGGADEGDCWKWLSGRPITDGWIPGEPSGNGTASCLDFIVSENPSLNDYICEKAQPYICEMGEESVTDPAITQCPGTTASEPDTTTAEAIPTTIATVTTTLPDTITTESTLAVISGVSTTESTMDSTGDSAGSSSTTTIADTTSDYDETSDYDTSSDYDTTSNYDTTSV